MQSANYNLLLSFDSREVLMHKAYDKTVQEILQREEEYCQPGGRLGLELEGQIVKTDSLDTVNEMHRDNIVAEDELHFSSELGASQIEIRTDPLSLSKGLKNLEDTLGELVSKAKKSLESGMSIMLSGFHPLSSIRDIRRSKGIKYQTVPDYYDQHRHRLIDTLIGSENVVNIGTAAIIGLSNSVQLNMEMRNFNEAIDLLNRSLAIGHIISGACSNARFIDGKDSGLADLRMIAWEQSHDVRSAQDLQNGCEHRVGLPLNYYRNMRDYLQRIKLFPFILNSREYMEKALEVGIGMNWKDSRLKFNRRSKCLILEFRPVSTQPSIAENIAVMCFYLGRLNYSFQEQEDLIPLEAVRVSRKQIMKKGLNANVFAHIDGKMTRVRLDKILPREIEKAEQGLIDIGVSFEEAGYYLDMIRSNLEHGTPAEKTQNRVKQLQNGSDESRRAAIIQTFQELCLI